MADLVNMATELLQIQQQFQNYIKHPDVYTTDDFDLTVFEQTWGNTSGGKEIIGGDSLTTEWTYVFIPKERIADREMCIVFFGASYGYQIPITNEYFAHDLKKKDIKGCMSAKTTYFAPNRPSYDIMRDTFDVEVSKKIIRKVCNTLNDYKEKRKEGGGTDGFYACAEELNDTLIEVAKELGIEKFG